MTATKVLLDTNIVSYLMKGGPFARLYKPHVENRLLSISFITAGELYYGAEKAGWGEKKRQHLETTLRNFVVVPYDHEIARCYARVADERRRKGKAISLHDAWIAACAIRHDIPLVTHNEKHFRDISDLELVSECVDSAE